MAAFGPLLRLLAVALPRPHRPGLGRGVHAVAGSDRARGARLRLHALPHVVAADGDHRLLPAGPLPRRRPAGLAAEAPAGALWTTERRQRRRR